MIRTACRLEVGNCEGRVHSTDSTLKTR
jgi:hypothetical protein